MMQILVTGAKGFIGRNLIATLNEFPNHTIFSADKETSDEDLRESIIGCDFIIHLAGVTRSEKIEDFYLGNVGSIQLIIETLIEHQLNTPILMTSSIHAELDSPYGQSKEIAEECLINYHLATGAPIYIYRLTNVFGKWCRPNYSSVVATFCYQIAREEEIWISDPSKTLNLVFIDDVIHSFIDTITQKKQTTELYLNVLPMYSVTLNQLVTYLNYFHESRKSGEIPDMKDAFIKKLYSTYLSYLPQNEFVYPLKIKGDQRETFTDFVSTNNLGQISINILKPGIKNGNHWHHLKVEKVLVVSGHGVIRLRQVYDEEMTNIFVSGEKLEVVDIPVGYTHQIENLGASDLIVIIWCNEKFDSEHIDTYHLDV